MGGPRRIHRLTPRWDTALRGQPRRHRPAGRRHGPALPGPGGRRSRRGARRAAGAARESVRRVSFPDRRRGHPPHAFHARRGHAGGRGPRRPGHPCRRRGRARACAARARRGAGRRDPDRAAGTGRSRPGGGLHDHRPLPRRCDLGLEHRDCRGPRGGPPGELATHDDAARWRPSPRSPSTPSWPARPRRSSARP